MMQLIKKLREEVQAPLNIVKAAASKAQPAGDYASALSHLKDEMTRRGEKLVAKSADRTTSEGWVIASRTADGKSAALGVLNCETDFVAKSDKIISLAQTIGQTLASHASSFSDKEGHATLAQAEIDAITVDGQDTVKDKLTDAMSLFGESIRMTRCKVTASTSDILGIHCHGGSSISKDIYLGRMGALVNIYSTEERNLHDMADELAREVVAQNPESIEEFWNLEKVGDAQGRSVRAWAGEDVQVRAWTRMERNE